jgi:hypothetical protein
MAAGCHVEVRRQVSTGEIEYVSTNPPSVDDDCMATHARTATRIHDVRAHLYGPIVATYIIKKLVKP